MKCFFGTSLPNISMKASHSRNREVIGDNYNVERLHILVEMMHGLGDTVCALPMIAELRYMYPHAYICVICKTEGEQNIIELSGITVDAIIVLDIYKSLYHTWNIISSLRCKHFDIGISSVITPVRKSKAFMDLCGVKHHAGYQANGFNVFSTNEHFVVASVYSARLVVQWYKPVDTDEVSGSKKFIEIDDVIRAPQLYIREKEKKYMLKRIGFYPDIALCIGNAGSSFTNRWLRCGKVYPKSWGIHKMKELLQLIVDSGYTVVLIGGQQELALLSSLGEYTRSSRVSTLVGMCDVIESMAAISLTKVVVGVDTGMQHIAAALGISTVSIFGPTNPKRCGAYGDRSFFVEAAVDCKYCYGTKRFIHCSNRFCLQQILPIQVFKQIESVLSDKMK